MFKSVNILVLIGLILVSVIFDLKMKKIPNFITLPVILWGLLAYLIFYGYEGFRFSGIGLLVGLLVFLIPFILGGIGGGDVKLMAAIGALMGARFVLITALFTGVAGGIIVILLLIKEKKLLITLKRVLVLILRPVLFILTITLNSKLLNRANSWLLESYTGWEKRYIPYGVAIGMGAIMAYSYLR